MAWEIDEGKTLSGRLRGVYQSAGGTETVYHTSNIYFDDSVPADSIASGVGALYDLTEVSATANEVLVKVVSSQDYYRTSD